MPSRRIIGILTLYIFLPGARGLTRRGNLVLTVAI
jgi:hypothetical protein